MAAAIAMLSTAALSLAGSSPPDIEPAPVEEAAVVGIDPPLTVPDVRRQPYVFAKGMIEDAGFAWRVAGNVEGFPANVVATQKPLPGTLVEDTGAPTIVLRLERNKDYEQRGLAKDSSPYKGTKLVLWNNSATPDATPAKKKKAKKSKAPEPSAPADTTEPTEPTEPPAASSDERPVAFVLPGANPEPLDEITLIARAEQLAAELEGKDQTAALVDHWLEQHAWIVQGAVWGWFSGEEALRRLIQIDDELQSRWGIGALSADLARDALAEVRTKTADAALQP